MCIKNIILIIITILLHFTGSEFIANDCDGSAQNVIMSFDSLEVDNCDFRKPSKTQQETKNTIATKD